MFKLNFLGDSRITPMNINKLAVATGLTSAIVLGAFVESADAQFLRRRLGHTYSLTSGDEQTLTDQFTLVDTSLDGTTIIDQALSDPDIGLFVGAIEDYADASGTVSICPDFNCSSNLNSSPRFVYDSNGYPVFEQPVQTSPESFDGNLLAEFIPGGEDPLLRSVENDAIAYTIFNQETGLEVSTYRLNLIPEDLANIPDFDRDQAVNSLTYILENNLLGNSDRMVYLTESGFSEPYPTDENVTGLTRAGNVLLQNVSTTPVPEPVSMLGTLAALGVGVLLKLKQQH